MKTKVGLSLILLVLVAGFNTAGATELIRVESSRNLRVAVVDASKPGIARSSIHESFSASLSASLQGQDGSTLPVKMIEATEDAKAASELSEGNVDAVLVFGNVLPSAFRGSNFAVTRGVSQVGAPVRVFHLVLLNSDAGMVSTLNAAFAETVKAPRFQEALSRSVAVRVVASNNP